MSLELLIIVCVAAIAATALTNRFRLIGPVMLIVAGLVASFAPGAEGAGLPSEVVLTVFLPVLLYWEALSVSLNGMRRALRGIILSATVLVVITSAIIMAAGLAMGLSAGAALLVGACLGPTDATAVAALGKGINRFGRTVLQAESLLNDGTALAVFAIALRVAAGGTGVSAASVTSEFAISIGAGVGVGVVCGAAAVLLWAKWNASRTDAMLSNLIALTVPFTTYFLAEELHGSGVLAVVACGIVYSRYNRNANDSAIRLVGIPFWSVLTYLMNTVLFIMVGLSLPDIIRRLPHQELVRGLVLIPIIYSAMVAARFVGHHAIIFSIRALDRRPQQRERRTNIRGRLVSTVAGFRGAISLAMALSIPGSFGGTAYEERDLVVLITAGVTLLSLVVQGIALPHVVRWANARPTAVQRREAEELDEETRVLAGIMRDIVEELPSMAQRIGVEDGELVNAIRESYGRREERMLQAASEEEFSFFDEDETALRLECIDFARARVLEARNAGRLDGATASLAIKRLDTEGALLAGPIEME